MTDTGRVVVVSNTLAEPRKEVHEVVVSDAAVEVVTLDGGRPVRAQAHPIWSTPKAWLAGVETVADFGSVEPWARMLRWE